MTFTTDPRTASHPLAETLDSQVALVSRASLDARIRQLVPCATERQLWLVMLDRDDVQLPVMIPIGDLAVRAEQVAAEGLADLLTTLTAELSPASFVFVAERPGSSAVTDDDRLWLTFLLGLTSEAVRVRAAYLCHDDGVSGYDDGDLDELSRRRHQAVSASSFDM
jgi:hypothetical protein